MRITQPIEFYDFRVATYIRLRSLRISATSVVHLHETKTAEDKQELGQEV